MSSNQNKLIDLYRAKNSFKQAIKQRSEGQKNCISCTVERISLR